ncbi:phage virion morphogenesis protein [Acinetobacter sp. ANC 4640]
MAVHFAALELAQIKSLEHGLKVCAERIEQTAKEEIGHYQNAIGPYPAWSPLAESTEEQKAKKGYPANSPLLASGEMQKSIKHEVSGLEAIVGATDKKMVYHEFGTVRIPPRPVIGPAAYRNKEFILKTIGEAAVTGIVGGMLSGRVLRG